MTAWEALPFIIAGLVGFGVACLLAAMLLDRRRPFDNNTEDRT